MGLDLEQWSAVKKMYNYPLCWSAANEFCTMAVFLDRVRLTERHEIK